MASRRDIVFAGRSRARSRAATALALAAVAFVPAASLWLAACGSGAGVAQPGKLQVVAGEGMWGGIAAQIGGARVQVTSFVTSPTADPHLYQSDAADAVAVARAAVVIVNGAGYDDFMGQLLSASGAHPRVVTAQDVLGAGADANPHFWYDLRRVPLVAAAIERALAAADPGGAATYRAGLARFDASLHPVLKVVDRIAAGYSGRPVAYTERVPGYLLADAGLANVTPPGFATAVENGNEPSAGDTQAMEGLIARHGIRLLLYNTQTTSAVTQHVVGLARQDGVPVVAVSETPPAGESFQAWQVRQARAVLRAVGG
jgi:zinc/manganese transport system substrate-binding protein